MAKMETLHRESDGRDCSDEFLRSEAVEDAGLPSGTDSKHKNMVFRSSDASTHVRMVMNRNCQEELKSG
jgi:hypothetical protein